MAVTAAPAAAVRSLTALGEARYSREAQVEASGTMGQTVPRAATMPAEEEALVLRQARKTGALARVVLLPAHRPSTLAAVVVPMALEVLAEPEKELEEGGGKMLCRTQAQAAAAAAQHLAAATAALAS
jgi:hypothetical protein